MKKSFFLGLSSIALLSGVVLTAQAFDTDGDCLEMMCPHGCIKSSRVSGKEGQARCCPAPVVGRCDREERDADDCLIKTQKSYDSTTQCCVNGVVKSIGACGKCENGTIVVDETKVGVCQTCNTTTWQLENKADGTAIGDCATCSAGVAVADGNKYNTTCQTCTAENNWVKQNEGNGSHKSDGKCCVNGSFTESATYCPKTCTDSGTTYNDGASIGSCKKCSNGSVVVDSNKVGQQAQDVCHMCNSLGIVAYKDGTKTVPCGTQCCATGKVCVNGECKNQCSGSGQFNSYTWYKQKCSGSACDDVYKHTADTYYTPEHNMNLDVSFRGVLGIDNYKFKVTDTTTSTTIANNPSLSTGTKYSTLGQTYNLVTTYSLTADHRYHIELFLYNGCDHCSLSASCK